VYHGDRSYGGFTEGGGRRTRLGEDEAGRGRRKWRRRNRPWRSRNACPSVMKGAAGRGVDKARRGKNWREEGTEVGDRIWREDRTLRGTARRGGL